MDDILLGIVLRRLGAVPLAASAADLLLAALEGDETLTAQLGGQPRPPSGAPADTTSPQTTGAYLRSLTVSGFRGIGAPATLEVAPQPGLTLVVGRNGSGKSRLAQARKIREAALKEVSKSLPGLLARLEAADDERAAACRRALAGRSWDLATARSVAIGARPAPGGGELDRLRRLALTTAARSAWQRWASPPEAASAGGAAGLRALAGHLDQALDPLTRQLAALSARASAEAARRDDRWIPLAAEVSSWCAAAAAAQKALTSAPIRPPASPTSSPPSATPVTTTPTNWPPPRPNSPPGSTRPPIS